MPSGCQNSMYDETSMLYSVMLKWQMKLSFFSCEPISVFLLSILVSYPHRVTLSTRPCLTHSNRFSSKGGVARQNLSVWDQKGIKKMKPVGASWRKDCISRREPQDMHTGQQTQHWQLTLMHTNIRELCSTFCFVFFNQTRGKQSNFQTFICILSLFSRIIENTHTHSLTCKRTHSSYSYLYDTGLRGMPVRCEERDGIIWSHGLSPPITKQSGLVLIFLWKHTGWKWCRKPEVAHQATWANPVQWSVFTLLLL